jgi:hypothetical protein
MDDQIELLDGYRQLDAGEMSPQTFPGTDTANPIGIRQSEMRKGDYADKRLNATECAYDPLDEGSIRLVRIAQDPTTGAIECWTEQFPLQHPPPYTALSYACGPRPASFNLKLNGGDWNVRQNLSHFLRQHMKTDRDSQEWLWIDAICINHANDSERTHQVRLMAGIYGKASRVIAWLGTAHGQSDDAMNGLLESKGDERALELVPWIYAVVDLCSRPYWWRLWVLQELKLAKQKDLMCGSKVISWHHLERFVLRVDGRFNASTSSLPSRSTEAICGSPAMRMIMLTQTPMGTSLLDLMDMSVYLQCEEPRDRVNALFGLATTEAASIDSDYETDLPLFLNTMFRHHIEQNPGASILTVISACKKLERLFGTQPGAGAIFELHGPTNHPPRRADLVYQRLCTRSIDIPGLTLLWAVHYDHIRVQELIKMEHRLRSPAYSTFCGLQGVVLIIGLSFVPRFLSCSDLTFGPCLMEIANIILVILSAAISINTAALQVCHRYGSENHLPTLSRKTSRNGEWEQESAWTFYTALKHRSTRRALWWVPFIIHEGFVYIAASARQSLKRWYSDFTLAGTGNG